MGTRREKVEGEQSRRRCSFLWVRKNEAGSGRAGAVLVQYLMCGATRAGAALHSAAPD